MLIYPSEQNLLTNSLNNLALRSKGNETVGEQGIDDRPDDRIFYNKERSSVQNSFHRRVKNFELSSDGKSPNPPIINHERTVCIMYY